MNIPEGVLGIASSINGTTIRLTEERWLHIVTGHSEIDSSEYSLALGAVEKPDAILKGDKGELLAVKKKPGKKIWFVVVYKEVTPTDGFIVTAYITTDTKWLFKRKVVWNKI